MTHSEIKDRIIEIMGWKGMEMEAKADCIISLFPVLEKKETVTEFLSRALPVMRNRINGFASRQCDDGYVDIQWDDEGKRIIISVEP